MGYTRSRMKEIGYRVVRATGGGGRKQTSMSVTLPPSLREYGFEPGRIVRVFFDEAHKVVIVRLVEDQGPEFPEELLAELEGGDEASGSEGAEEALREGG